MEQFDVTEFIRDSGVVGGAQVLAVVELDDEQVEVFLDKRPFTESGGQIGDTGTIKTESGVIEIQDCTYALPGAASTHRSSSGRNHSFTLHGYGGYRRRQALGYTAKSHRNTHPSLGFEEVLGDHVKQAGSLVAADRLRFDFNHFEAVTDDELAQIEDLVNGELLTNAPCRHYETTMEHAQEAGAIAFFGDKYGDMVRVLEAGQNSLELCGGTHVDALGDIGHLRIISESSIGSNIRRVEAITGLATVERLQSDELLISQMNEMLNTSTEELLDTLRRRLGEIKDLRNQIKTLQQVTAGVRAGELADTAEEGVVVARLDGLGARLNSEISPQQSETALKSEQSYWLVLRTEGESRS